MELTLQTTFAASDRTVLVVDDDRQVSVMLEAWLEALGYGVEVADSGAKALSLLADNDYDAVICDLLMPEMCGDEVFRVCRERRPEVARRFVFLSGSPGEVASSDRSAATGQPYLPKPCRLAEIQAALAQVTLPKP